MWRGSFAGRTKLVAISALFAVAARCFGQMNAVSTVLPATAAVLQQMTRSAGVIFAGTVIAVKRPAGYEGTGYGTVTVEFRVDEAVRGSTSGSVYTLKEWGGLWSASGDRYLVGQRVLMFLHLPGSSGLSSPVHGAAGAVPLRGGGVAPGPYDTGVGAGVWMADLRWVQAQAVRSAVDRNEGGLSGPEAGRTGTSEPRPAGDERGNAATGDLLPVEGGGRAAHWRELSPVTTGAYVPLAQMLELCRGWMGAP